MEYSKTEPKVCEGDLVVLGDGTQLLVREIIKGIPYGCTYGNDLLPDGPYAMGATAAIVCKYKKVILNDNWKLPDGTPFNQYISGIDPISGELPSCVMHTRSMSVEDIIKEYGDHLTEEQIEMLADLALKDSKKEFEELSKKGFVEGLLYGSSSYHISKGSFLDTLKEESLKQIREDFERINVKRINVENVIEITVSDEGHLKNKEFKALSEKIEEANKTSFGGIRLEVVVSKPWGSYRPTKYGFFIPPVRKPYEPDFVQFSGRIKRHIIPAHILDNTWCNANKPTTDQEQSPKMEPVSEEFANRIREDLKMRSTYEKEKSTTDFVDLKKDQTKYNILMNELCNKVTTEKLEAVVEYLSEVIRKNLSSKKKVKVFRKIRKIYG